MLYRGKQIKNISFPLGGIGTGSISLGGNGELKEWEIFNRPDKCTRNGYSHFAVKAAFGDQTAVKVLQGDTTENLMGTPCATERHFGYGYGPRDQSMAGFPHFRNVTFDGSFPTAALTFSDGEFPATVRLCAFNPLIPHDDWNSSLPAAFFEWEIENTANQTVHFALSCTVCNPAVSSLNQKVADGEMTGVFLRSADKNEDEIGYSDLCVLTDCEDSVAEAYWYRGLWKDTCTTYWKNFSELDRIPERNYDSPAKNDHGTVAAYVDIPAGGKKKIRFVIAWNVPIAQNYWQPRKDECQTWRNYYATQFENSLASAKYALENFDSLCEKTRLFSDTLQSCSLSASVKDAVSANLSVLKTPTVLRLEDGSFWGWEGCSEKAGSCYGTCQHVWNYAYALPYLFPRLERSIRENMMNYALVDSGATSFRLNLPLKKEMSTDRACVDGQMGEVIKCYREWKFSGDTDWLGRHAERIFKMLEFAWSEENPDLWDADMDGVMEGRQHHTLDMELFGPNSWLEGFYLLALDCGAEMARALGDTERANLYQKLYENGKAWMNGHLFNGRYFHQLIDLSNKATLDRYRHAGYYWNDEAKEIKYQVADGCVIDQMLADWHAILIGREGVFDPDKKRIALQNLYKNNYKPSMREVTNMWRNFSLDDEAGTVICSYPEGAKVPAIPISYCEETMTGFEYALAGLLIAEGYQDEGETLVKAIRDRYDGEKRNPWNEIECGSHYARSMASYALMPIYSGFSFDMTRKHIGFAPIEKEGKFLFSVGESWGSAEFLGGRCVLSVLGNALTLDSVSIPDADRVTRVTLDGCEIPFALDGDRIVLGNVRIHKELSLQ